MAKKPTVYINTMINMYIFVLSTIVTQKVTHMIAEKNSSFIPFFPKRIYGIKAKMEVSNKPPLASMLKIPDEKPLLPHIPNLEGSIKLFKIREFSNPLPINGFNFHACIPA